MRRLVASFVRISLIIEIVETFSVLNVASPFLHIQHIQFFFKYDFFSFFKINYYYSVAQLTYIRTLIHCQQKHFENSVRFFHR